MPKNNELNVFIDTPTNRLRRIINSATEAIIHEERKDGYEEMGPKIAKEKEERFVKLIESIIDDSHIILDTTIYTEEENNGN